MSEYGEGDDTLDDTTAAANNSANNSLISKVRTGVSNILPNSLSKWFSPSTTKSESSSNGNKRRHNYESDTRTPTLPQRRNIANDFDDDNDDEIDDNGDGDVLQNVRKNAGLIVQPRRSLNASLNDEPPPVKRSRIIFDGSMIDSRPLVASTPAVSVQRTTSANHYGRFGATATTRTPIMREPGYNFFPNTAESADLGQQNNNPDIIDFLIPTSSGSNDIMPERNNNQSTLMEPACSRRTLNIPPTTTTYSIGFGSGESGTLKRQSLHSIKGNLCPTENNNTFSDIQQEAAALDELNEDVLRRQQQEQKTFNGQVQMKFQNGNESDFYVKGKYGKSSTPTDSDVDADGDEDEETGAITDLPMKRLRRSQLAAGSLKTEQPRGLFNMSTSSVNNNNNSRNGSRASSFGNGLNFDTHLEGRKSLFASGSGVGNRVKNFKSGLGNSTFSLNSLSRRQFNASIYGSTSALSDSRLLNATSTTANATTNSPFYKGNTTYGGAAAYRKYPTLTTSSARLTPTMMRPLSSLSTLSSSNNSLAGIGEQQQQQQRTTMGASTSATSSQPLLSGSAKLIYDALNKLTTPINDAKKMASSLQQQRHHQKVSTTSNNNNIGAISLLQTTKPYMRPTVILRPKNTISELLASTTKSATAIQALPPVRELQVPSMPQLVTMKQLQNSTERSRQIVMQKATNQTFAMQKPLTTASSAADATLLSTTTISSTASSTSKMAQIPRENLPSHDINKFKDQQQQQQQSKHVNKIRHKVHNTRSNALDCIENEPSTSQVCLPQIPFPVMKELPKIDFGLPTATTSISSSSLTQPSAPSTASAVASMTTGNLTSSTKASADDVSQAAFKFSPPTRLTSTSSATSSSSSTRIDAINFQFCEPVSLKAPTKPVVVASPTNQPIPFKPTNQQSTKTQAPSQQPTLKVGSCLDALKPKAIDAQNKILPSSFGDQFKKLDGQWECDACMVRNQAIAQKCVACETPRKLNKTEETTTSTTSTPFANSTLFSNKFNVSSASGFGNLFKKQAGEWECDACMLRNKPDATKCISCETARKSVAVTTKTTSNTATIDTGFKAIVAAQNSSTWECDACMTRNDAAKMKCVCCEQAKPGAGVIGSSAAIATTPKADDAFKALAAKQSAAKWECEACMTRNESTRTKCACCEQAKPGATNNDTNGGGGGMSNLESTAPKFSFGTTAAAKFNFGFAAAGNENELRAKSSSTTTLTAEIKPAKTEGVKGGFTFGLKPTTTTVAAATTPEKSFMFGQQKASKDAADGGGVDGTEKPKGFTFGLSNVNTTTTPSTNGAATTTTTATVAPLSFGSLTKSAPAATATLTTTESKPAFTFGLLAQQKSEESNKPTSTTTTITTTATTSTSAATTNLFGQQAFNFAKPTTTSSASISVPSFGATAEKKPNLFGFASTTTAATSTTTSTASATMAAASASASTTTTSTTSTTGFGGIAGGFNFMANKTSFGLAATTSPPTTTTTAATTLSAFGTSQKENTNTINSLNNNNTAPPINAAFGGNFAFGTNVNTNTNAAIKTEGINSNNVFGNNQSKPIAPATAIFGNSIGNQNSQITTTTSAAATWATPNTPSTLFGVAAPSSSTQTKSPFGNFDSNNSSTTTTAASSSLFNIGGATASATPGLFGSNNNNNAAISTFGVQQSTTSTNNNNNIFGLAMNNSSSSNNNSPFAANATASPAFGNAATTFGGFGNVAPAASVGQQQQSNNMTNANAISAQSNVASATAPAFQFGAQTTNSGGFNFGNTAAARPSFNFTANIQQPSFNFTGSSTESNQNATRPFQFGATPQPAAASAVTAFGNPQATAQPSMFFGFGGAQTSTETTNTPFQFGAGNPSQQSTNIFAPSASSTAQTSAAARRRGRMPTRRLTPR